eukprot:TRINITY_DN71740_c0_g1_i1.p1 TRINITY_DN71740_c0_g1~~TRINITY_DN71740_c0_g1_i1.p1  ORF type:complete len:527 (+),score=85.64 TRINITY_DN71740_c0_g1_i1:55-1635(+)
MMFIFPLFLSLRALVCLLSVASLGSLRGKTKDGQSTRDAASMRNLTFATPQDGSNHQSVEKQLIEPDELAKMVFENMKELPRWKRALGIESEKDIHIDEIREGAEGYVVKLPFAGEFKKDCEPQESSVAIKIGKEATTSRYEGESAEVRTMCIADELKEKAGFVVSNLAWSVGEDLSTVMIMPTYDGDLADYMHSFLKEHFTWTSPDQVRLLKNIVGQVASGTHAILRNRVVHTDVKPENIMFKCVKNEPGLCMFHFADFGGACRGSCSSRFGIQQPVDIATPGYMPPEVMKEYEDDKRSMVDRSFPLYALGVIAYELSTGKQAPASNCSFKWKYECYFEAADLAISARETLTQLGADVEFIEPVMNLLGEPMTQNKRDEAKQKFVQFRREYRKYRIEMSNFNSSKSKPPSEPECDPPRYDIQVGIKGLELLKKWGLSKTDGTNGEMKVGRPKLKDLGFGSLCAASSMEDQEVNSACSTECGPVPKNACERLSSPRSNPRNVTEHWDAAASKARHIARFKLGTRKQ